MFAREWRNIIRAAQRGANRWDQFFTSRELQHIAQDTHGQAFVGHLGVVVDGDKDDSCR